MHQIDPNRRRRRVQETNGRILSGNRDSPQRNSALYSRTKRRCRTGKQDDLQMNLHDPCRHGSPERTLGRAGTPCHPYQESQPHTGAQEQDTLRGALRRKPQRFAPCCNRHQCICVRPQDENAKAGFRRFRRNYGRIWRISSISNLDPWDKQNQGISGCPFCGRRNKEYDSSWDSGSARYGAAY